MSKCTSLRFYYVMAPHSTENMEFVSKAKTYFLVKLNLKKAHEINILNLPKKIWINVFSLKMSKKIVPDIQCCELILCTF